MRVKGKLLYSWICGLTLCRWTVQKMNQALRSTG